MSYVVLLDDPATSGGVVLVDVDDAGEPLHRTHVPAEALAAEVRRREGSPDEASAAPVRWVWDDTARRYPPLLAAGARVERCHDLRLCHAILRRSVLCAGSALATAPQGPWDVAGPDPSVRPRSEADRRADRGEPTLLTLFDATVDDAPRRDAAWSPGPRPAAVDPLDELRAQVAAVAGSSEPGRLRLLLAAESTGALIAAEMRHDGLPWDAEAHDRLLTQTLGPRPEHGGRPARLEALAGEIRTLLGRPGLNPDSQPDLLGAMRSAGLPVSSTRTQEIRAVDHPVVAPLLEYKKLARLLSANGWHWMEQWVRDGRFRPDYVPGGVVTGRWATSGGGALQLPAVVRGAVRADPGWRLVVADAAQLEPRILAAMSGDEAMAATGRSADMYQGVVDAGIVATRTEAKYAMLGAIYGATTGAGGALMPRLRQAFPRAIAVVDEAARAGERGQVVSTWLGRTSPDDPVGDALREAAVSEVAEAEEVRAARRHGRDWGRFTRNFVVQGSAAEWALCWMAALRRRLGSIDGRPHLVFFLHDEVIVHTPAAVADDVVAAVTDAAAEAGRLLFATASVEFTLDVSVVDSYDQTGEPAARQPVAGAGSPNRPT